MSDSIIGCTLYKNIDGSIKYYEVIFSLDNVIFPTVSPLIFTVNREDLINPTDLIEVKKIACQKASIMKNLYSTATSINDLNGLVSL